MAEYVINKILMHESMPSKFKILTCGGRAAKVFFEELIMHKDFNKISNLEIYMTDERYVDELDPANNYLSVFQNLIPSNGIAGVKLFRIKTDNLTIEESAELYNKTLPDEIDLLLLSVGCDGHVASLFPLSSELLEVRRKVVFTQNVYNGFKRVTITKKVIENAIEIIVLCIDKHEFNIFENILNPNTSFFDYPAKILKEKTWILN
jgi:6-phosphogluconolactonase